MAFRFDTLELTDKVTAAVKETARAEVKVMTKETDLVPVKMAVPAAAVIVRAVVIRMMILQIWLSKQNLLNRRNH